MRITRCDLCGKELRRDDNLFIIEISDRAGFRICAPDLYDLCKDCKETLETWLKAYRWELP